MRKSVILIKPRQSSQNPETKFCIFIVTLVSCDLACSFPIQLVIVRKDVFKMLQKRMSHFHPKHQIQVLTPTNFPPFLLHIVKSLRNLLSLSNLIFNCQMCHNNSVFFVASLLHSTQINFLPQFSLFYFRRLEENTRPVLITFLSF